MGGRGSGHRDPWKVIGVNAEEGKHRRKDADGTVWEITAVDPGAGAQVILTMVYRDIVLSSIHGSVPEAKRHVEDMLRAFAARNAADYAQPASTGGDDGGQT